MTTQSNLFQRFGGRPNRAIFLHASRRISWARKDCRHRSGL